MKLFSKFVLKTITFQYIYQEQREVLRHQGKGEMYRNWKEIFTFL